MIGLLVALTSPHSKVPVSSGHKLGASRVESFRDITRNTSFKQIESICHCGNLTSHVSLTSSKGFIEGQKSQRKYL